jgi:TonB family protein
LVLASDEDGGSLDALKYSLASDIVELVVLTADEAFLHTLREAVGGTRRLWHVLSDDKVSDLLVAGEVGIVVVDVKGLREVPQVFIGQIKRQFPDLVVVVAGNRDDEMSLAGLISAGFVYRFIHKPMSPARAKLFVEAAIKKYEDQRRRAAETPRRGGTPRSGGGWLIAGAVGIAVLIAGFAWIMLHRSTNSTNDTSAAAPTVEGGKPSLGDSPLLARAGAALAANRLADPAGDNALELYRAAQSANPGDAAARAGLAEVHERLLARAENALLEERLDEAAAAIEVARKSGVEAGRLAFLSAQLAKSREQVKPSAAQSQAQLRAQAPAPAPAAALLPVQARATSEPKSDDNRVLPAAEPSKERINDGRVPAPPDGVSAPSSAIDNAKPMAAQAGSEPVSAPSARPQAPGDSSSQLLKNVNERILQDRLVEPANDNAKYYLQTLRQVDPANPALVSVTQDLGSRIVQKARRALVMTQFDAAKTWWDEAAAIGYVPADAASIQRDLDAGLAQQHFMTTLIPASELKLLKSVQPVYPARAQNSKTEGWVDVEFTVSESGKVKDAVARATSVPGIFDDAAVKAVSQWRYQPMLRDAKPVAVRTQIRIRFAMP